MLFCESANHEIKGYNWYIVVNSSVKVVLIYYVLKWDSKEQ